MTAVYKVTLDVSLRGKAHIGTALKARQGVAESQQGLQKVSTRVEAIRDSTHK